MQSRRRTNREPKRIQPRPGLAFLKSRKNIGLVVKLLLAAATCVPLNNAVAQEILVIAHPSTRVPPDGLKDIYLGETSFSGSARLHAVHNANLQSEFTQRALGMNPVKYRAVWTKKSFREGLNPLPVRSTDSEVIEFVKANAGALGYVESTQGYSDLVVIQRIPISGAREREHR
jgi:hypothetical protein